MPSSAPPEPSANAGRWRGQVGKVAVVIPVLNEEQALPLVLREIPADLVERVVVVDNGSSDHSAALAQAEGAEVIVEPARGYGRACLAGVRHLLTHPPEFLVFLDGDHSDYPEQMPALLAPLFAGAADLVVGSRMLGRREAGALHLHSRLGNRLAAGLLRLLYGLKATDLGPFRAIRFSSLLALGMSDPSYGWTAEMQAKAARRGLRVVEVPVGYSRRIGRSKITGSLLASAKAGAKILWTLIRLRLAS